MKHGVAALRGTVGRLVLRVLARMAYDSYIRAESRLTQARSFRRASADNLAAARRRVKEARAIHERFQERLLSRWCGNWSARLMTANGDAFCCNWNEGANAPREAGAVAHSLRADVGTLKGDA